MRIATLIVIASASVLSLTACGPHPSRSTSASVQKVAAAVPTAIARDTFKTCKWEKVSGAHISIWSFNCGPDMGGEHLIADDKAGGFELVSGPVSASDAATPEQGGRIVIRSFGKPAGDITAALPAIRAASPGPSTRTCALVPAPYFDAWHAALYVLQPTGAAATAWNKSEANGDQAAPPCGDLGVGYAGDHFFTVPQDDPTRVLSVDMGSEIQIFDPNTIEVY